MSDDDVMEGQGVEAVEDTETLFRVPHDPGEPSLEEAALEDGVDPDVPGTAIQPGAMADVVGLA